MTDNINYRKNVNQQLAGAAFQLSLLRDTTLSLSSLQQSSCRQSALFHLYISVGHYINEVLAIYKREPIDLSKQSLAVLFGENFLTTYAVIELNELQQWYARENSLFNYLIELNQKLRVGNEQKSSGVLGKNNVIVAVNIDEPLGLLIDTQKVILLKKELSDLIDRQRESLLEH